MTIEIAAPVTTTMAPAAGTSGAAGQAGYNIALGDLNGFEQALARAGGHLEAQPVHAPGAAAEALLRPLDDINGEAVRLSNDARLAQAAGREMSPGEIVTLTVRCQEFMFHCQLTSNIANRTADGLQQLFRQQS
jgi:hypothetical protein